jgi:hypothetical protein
MRITFSAAICGLRLQTDKDHRIASSSSKDSTGAVARQQRVIVALESTHLRWSMQPPVEDRFKADPGAAPYSGQFTLLTNRGRSNVIALHYAGQTMHKRHVRHMKKSDIICPNCNAGYRRVELASGARTTGEFRCLLCDHVLEVFDGTAEVAIRLTVQPEKTFQGINN